MEIREFDVAVSDQALADLRGRLAAARWPDAQTPDDWSQGVPLSYMQSLADYWERDYDWRRLESRLNALGQFQARIDDLDVHFMHVPSPIKNARPLVVTHGWPGSIVEFLKVVEPLADPVAHGGSEADAFHVVCPSLPGYGFSGKPAQPGCGVARIASMWDTLMAGLGYERYFAQGGDWGSAVTTAIGIQNAGHCAGIHVNMPNAGATRAARENPDAADQRALEGAAYYQKWDSGYSKQQSTRPQTLGYGLADSPVGQLAWILEKFWAWTDCDGHPENVLTRDELLDNVMLYWITNAGASSARLYWESFGQAFADPKATVSLPVGCSIFPKEIVPTPRSWAERRYTNIVYWNELDRGGHFAAFEQPELFVGELRAAFANMSL